MNRRTGVRTHGHRCVRPTLYLLHHSRLHPKTLGKQIVNRSGTELEQSPHDQFCRKNRPPFTSKGFFHKQLSLDLARVQRPTRWTSALFRAHTPRSMIRHLWRSYKRLLRHRHRIFATFFTPIDTNLILSDSQIVRDPTRINCFYGHMLMQYQM